MITEKAVEIRTSAGVADGYLYADEKRPAPGVIQLQDIMGVREQNRAMARRLAEAGYTVLLPNQFYRSGRPPLFDFEIKFGDERTMKRFGELTGPLTPEAQAADAGAYLDFLAAHPAVRSTKFGVAGYCFSGGVALRMAAAHPDKIAAAASLHGGGLYTDQPNSPHHLLPKIKAQLLIAHAKEDRSMPKEAIERLDRELDKWGGKFEAETYDALHGWTTPGRAEIYHHDEAERAFKRLSALFKATLN
jgi:carboxymethylenebutenolidase